MIAVSSYDIRLNFDYEYPQRSLHFMYNFRLSALLQLKYGNTQPREPAAWRDRLQDAARWQDTMYQTFDIAVDHRLHDRTVPSETKQIVDQVCAKATDILGSGFGELDQHTFKSIATTYGMGFAVSLMGYFYCIRCDEVDYIPGVMQNEYEGVIGSGESVRILRDYYQTRSILSPTPAIPSCPYCSPASFNLGPWKRMLARTPNICTCDACGR